MSSESSLRRSLCAVFLLAAASASAGEQSAIVDEAAGLRRFAETEAARPRAPRLPRARFAAQSMLRTAQISPDGVRVAAIIEQGGARGLWVATAREPNGRRVLERTTATALRWSMDGRWLFLDTADQLFGLAMDGQRGSGAWSALGGRSRREFVDVDPWLAAAALVLEHPPLIGSAPKRWRLWRVRPGAGEELLHEDAREIVDFAFAPDGRLTHLSVAEGEGHTVLGRNGSDWTALIRCVRVEMCELVGTTQGGSDLVLISNHGTDLRRLAVLGPAGTQQTLHLDPRGFADLDEVALDPRDNRPRVAAYTTAIPRLFGLDDEAKAVVERLEARFPGRNLRVQPAGAAWLVHERGASLHGVRLHLFAPASGNVVELFPELAGEDRGRAVPRIPEVHTAREVAIRWRASDGMWVHGFLLIPPGVEAARAPLMVNVHGGPWAHVRPEWSRQAQFFANRGFIVFTPNFRGSTGYGRRYLFATEGDFGGAGRVQRDIVEGTRWLLESGIGDPDRVGISGASFGGYSTLLGLSFTPELFKVGIAAVPVVDLARQVREYSKTSADYVRGVPIAISLRDLGVDPHDAAITERLHAQSPLANADKMARPLLLFAGGEDDRIPIRAVTHYAAQLQLLQKDVSLFVDEDGGHSNDDARTREAVLYLQELLLHRVFGTGAPEAPSVPLQEHLDRNLRLAGRSLTPGYERPAARN